ncbi:hypothetical protein [Mycobacterium sp. 852013-50091_SCH5140682]|uniref:Mu transposase domain-containing protein n=1 Tax=Mycobacterium sp. 852013-50091_SCH5140682 TaxID=1834109 RepID=UPI00336C174D
MEGEISRFRRRHLVPVPAVASLAELNRHIAAGNLLDDARVITGRPHTVAEAFAAELPALQPLAEDPFDPALGLRCRGDLRARVTVRQCYYSVPERYAGRRLAVRMSATTVQVFDAARLVARHDRAPERHAEVTGPHPTSGFMTSCSPEARVEAMSTHSDQAAQAAIGAAAREHGYRPSGLRPPGWTRSPPANASPIWHSWLNCWPPK